MSELTITVGPGLELVADAYGDPSDPPVVFLHGGGQTRHSWGNSAQRFGAAGWYALTVDLRGHGDSSWSPDGNYDIDRFAGDVRQICRFLGRPTALVGASLGGISSMLAASRLTLDASAPEAAAPDDDLVAALVLVDVAPNVEAEGVQRIRAFMSQGLAGFASLEEAADAIATYNPHRPRPASLEGLKKNLRERDGRWHWHWDPAFMGSVRLDEPADAGAPEPTRRTGREPAEVGIDGMPIDRYAPPTRLEQAASTLTMPVLVVRGGSSDLLSEEGVQAMLRLVPHARRADVAGAGHMVAGDRNDPFNDAVRTFLDDVFAGSDPADGAAQS